MPSNELHLLSRGYQLAIVGLTAVLVLALSPSVGVPRKRILEGLLVIILGSILFTIPISLILLWLTEKNLPRELSNWNTGGILGYSALGYAIITTVLGAIWGLRRCPKQFFGLGTLGVLALSFSYGFLKLGCLGTGCCYGARTFGWYAVQFAKGTPAFHMLGPNHFVHPVQLYESFVSLMIFFTVLFFMRKPRLHRALSCFGLMALALMRAILEQFRYNPPKEFFQVPFLNFTSILAALVMVVCGLIYIRGGQKDKRDPADSSHSLGGT